MEKVLFIDDDPDMLMGFRRILKKHMEIVTATSGGQGLAVLRSQGPFAVIVCDMKMPIMDGISFFSQVRGFAPESVRIMLTGVTDLNSTISAINEGHIFRFLTKPCDTDTLCEAVESGITHYRKIVEERRRKEEELKRLSMAIEQASDSVFITDTHGTIMYVNPTTSRLSGYTQEELLGAHPRLFTSGRHDTLFYKNMWETLIRGEAWKGHIINKRKDGSLYEIDATISPVRNDDGAIVHYIASSRDVTREMELKAQLHHAQKMETIGVLAGGIAHNFNNILTAILAYSQLAQSQITEESDIYGYLTEIHNAGLRARDMTREILDFSRKVQRMKKPVEINPIVKDALRLIRASISNTIRIEQDLSIKSGHTVGDPGQIHQIVMNLCTNAFHAMKGSKGILQVSVDHQCIPDTECANGILLNAGEYIRIIVGDNGHGMDKDTMEHIFLPFFTTKKEGEGTGLGLSTACSILKEHNGGISAASETGKGSTFTIYLPRIVTADNYTEEQST